MDLQRKLLENSAYRMFTEKLLHYMMERTGTKMPQGVVLGNCCLCDESEWIRNVTTDKDPLLVAATLKPGRFNTGNILVNTRKLTEKGAFSIFCMSMNQFTMLSINTIHELVHFWYDEHGDQFYTLLTQTGVIVDYDTPWNFDGYLEELGIDEDLMLNAAEFLVDTYNEIELSELYSFALTNNLLFRV